MNNTARRLIASLLTLSVSLTALPVRAEIVSTEAALESSAADAAASSSQQRLQDFLAREDVQRALTAQGVDPAEAQARARALSEAEARELAGRIDSAPAGGDVLGLLFSVFVILLVTDILGFTKVFPFTRSIR